MDFSKCIEILKNRQEAGPNKAIDKPLDTSIISSIEALNSNDNQHSSDISETTSNFELVNAVLNLQQRRIQVRSPHHT